MECRPPTSSVLVRAMMWLLPPIPYWITKGKNSYTLLITAADADDPGRKATATVTVNVADLNEAPYFDKESRDEVQNVARLIRVQ